MNTHLDKLLSNIIDTLCKNINRLFL